jgi:hypothetical protein
VNTYAKLGEKYTAIGYMQFVKNGAAELRAENILGQDIVQDRVLSSTKKTLEKIDEGLFYMFETVEKINRGAAYYGAKQKALDSGKTVAEAVEYAKEVVRKTQFQFGSIDSPVLLQGDIAKTLVQLQTFSIKQAEFLAEMVKNKEFAGLFRFAIGSMVMLYTIGQLLGMEWKDLLPSFRFDAPPTLKLPREILRAIFSDKGANGYPATFSDKAADMGNSLIPYIPAGSQIKKTYQGLNAVSEGQDTTKTGKTRYTIPQTTGKYIRAGLFGKYTLPEAKQYFEDRETPSPKKANAILEKYKITSKSGPDVLQKYGIRKSSKASAILKKYNLK